MKRWSSWCLTLAVALAGAPVFAQGEETPAEGGATPGQGQQPARLTTVLVLPFVNDGQRDADFWSVGLGELVAATAREGYLTKTLATAPELLEGFRAGQLNASRPDVRTRCLTAVPADLVLVGRYALRDKCELKADLFDPARPTPAQSVNASGDGPFAASQKLADALAAKLGGQAAQQAQPGGGGEGEGEGGGMTLPPLPIGGRPRQDAAAGGATLRPLRAGPPAGAENPEGEGVGGGEGGVVQQPVAIEYPNLTIEPWARGMALWPFRRATEAYRGDLAAAARLFEQQLTTEPKFALGYTHAALTAIALGESDRGVALQRAFTEAQEPCGTHFQQLAVVLLAAELDGEALAALEQAATAQLLPRPLAALTAAELLADRGRFDEAIAKLQETQRRHPGLREAPVALGRTQLKAGQAKAAARTFDELLANQIRTPEVFCGAVDAYLGTGFVARAADIAKLASDTLPQVPAVWLKLTETQLALGRADAAARAAQEAIRLAPDNAAARAALGDALLAAGAVNEAAAAYGEASRLRPEWTRPRTQLAQCKLLGDQPAEALRLMDEALRRANVAELAETALVAAKVAFYNHDFPRALQFVHLADDYHPDSPAGRLIRSYISLYQGDEPAAWEQFVAAYEQADNALLREALDIYLAAVNNKIATGRVAAGLIYERLGQLEPAREQYRKYRAEQARGFLLSVVRERLAATEKRN